MIENTGVLVLGAIVLGIWLSVLTLVVLVLMREVAIHGVRLELRGDRRMPTGVDGIEVGQQVPDEFSAALPEVREPLAYVLVMSALCAPCRELASQLAAVRTRLPQLFVALVPGRAELADSLIAMLPAPIRSVRDPEATALADLVKVRATPFLLQIEHGGVTGKAMARSTEELMQLIDDRHTRGRTPLLQIHKVAANVD